MRASSLLKLQRIRFPT